MQDVGERASVRAVGVYLVGWLGLAGAGWGFVKYKRGITDASFVDIAFFPLRHRHYRETLSSHYHALAQKQLETGAWSKALVSLRLAIANNAKNLQARQQLADIYRQINRPDFAIDLLEAGLKDEAKDTAYMRDLFNLLQQTNRNTRIITLGNELLPAVPDQAQDNHELVYQIVKAHIRLKQPDQAKALLEKWQLDRTLPGQLLLADIEVATGYSDLAIMRLENIARGRNSNEMVGLRLVSLYKDTGRLDDARRIAIQRMIKFPDSPGAHVDLISLLHDSKDMAAFEGESKNYIERHDTDARAMLLLASAAMRLHEPKLALMVRDRAPKNEQGYPAAVFQMIVMHTECLAGEYQSALDATENLFLHQNLSPADQAGATTIRVWANYGLGKTTEA